MEIVRCDLCGSQDSEVLYTGEGWRQPVPQGCQLVRCRQCGLMYLNPRPAADEIGQYYPPEYGSFRPAVEDERFGLMRRMRQRKLARRRLLVEKYSGCKSGNILDVGCATGLFLHEMASSGWRAKGVELAPLAARYARERFGLEVFQGLLSEAPYAPGSFDAITFWDVLEHSFSPSADLRLTSELLRPGGLVAINIPNWHSPDREIFGPHWIGLDPPRHLYVFTRETLTALLRKAGFQPVQWICFMPSYYSFIISLERRLAATAPRLAGPVNRLLNFPGMRFLFEPYFTVANWMKRGGVIAVFARKETTE